MNGRVMSRSARLAACLILAALIVPVAAVAQPAPAPAPPAGELEQLREQNRRLQEEIERLRAPPAMAAPTVPAPPPPLPPAGPGCLRSGGVRYCLGWAVTTAQIDPRSRASAPIGRRVVREASRVVLDAASGHATIELRGEAFFQARQAGEHSFLLEVSTHWRNRCQASLTLGGETIATASMRSPAAAGSRPLQPGLHPLGFRFACELLDPGLARPALALRVLAPGDAAPRPFQPGGTVAQAEIVHEEAEP